jgi:predicted ATP-binding protein involved in virulence
MLKELHLKLVGPAPQFDVEFADRLNIFTGDNGLGKTFLLDVAWWSLTNTWMDYPALPQRIREEIPEINFYLNNRTDSELYRSFFDFSALKWRSCED